MPQFTGCQFLGMDLTKPKLDSNVPIPFLIADLGNVTWPSFDDRHRTRDALLIEDLGHADLLSNKPFQHTRFSPSKYFVRLSTGASVASSPGNAVKQPHGMLRFVDPVKGLFLRCRNSRAGNGLAVPTLDRRPDYILISISTPAGRLSRINMSIVFESG